MTDKLRPIPGPIFRALREQFPRLLYGGIAGDNVYLVMEDEPGTAVRYVASPEFMTAVRVCDSGDENAELLATGGFPLTLLAPSH